MKFNWGTGIAIFYGVFVLALVFQVIKSTQYDHSLVSDHYYADDLAYQSHYDKLLNTQNLKKDLEISEIAEEGLVAIKFPEDLGNIQGEILLFCPSDSKLDLRVPIQTDANFQQVLPVRGLKPGLWKLKVDWQAGGNGYYKEEALTVPKI